MRIKVYWGIQITKIPITIVKVFYLIQLIMIIYRFRNMDPNK